LRRVVANGTANVLVAEVEGQIVGSIIGTFDGWRGNIYRLAVHPNYGVVFASDFPRHMV
jgi:hypothetical protein